ncbi:MAG TPA: DMT family transporter [Burkholderiaceae bacterium]|nr:DMT family transporter [Burkholderiaceae bacterium]
MATLATRTSSLINPHSMSAAFIVLWSTAWIAGKFGLQFTGPLTLLEIRMAAAALFMLLIAGVTRAPWPRTWREYVHLAVVGLLINGLTLAAMYIGMKAGVSTGVSALIAALTPLFTAVAAGALFGESIGARRWAGLAVGLFGVALVVMHRVSFTGAGWEGYAITFLAVVLFVAGTLYQKRYCGEIDLRTGNAIQFAVASVALLIPALGLEGLRVEWTETLVLSVAWMALVNSGVAVSLYYLLLRQGQASRVATLFYLVPPITAAMGFFAFHETLGSTALVGFALAAAGVYFGSGNAAATATATPIRTGSAAAVCTGAQR